MTLALVLNLMAARYFWQRDLTRAQVFTLSAETQAYLQALEQPVEIIAAIPSEPDGSELERSLARNLHDTLDAFRFAARRGGEEWLRVQVVDVYADVRMGRELEQRHGVQGNFSVVFRQGDRAHMLRPPDLVELTAEGEATAYRTERAFTTALMHVTRSSAQRIYFTIGHGEMRLDDVSARRGLSRLATALRQRGLEANALDLTQAGRVPDNAGMVVVMDPQGTFLPEELRSLRDYLARREGRVVVLLGPDTDAGLGDLLAEWGLRAEERIIIEPSASHRREGGGIILRQINAEHPVTKGLVEQQTPVVAELLRPVRRDPSAPADERLRIEALLLSSKESWASAQASRPYDARTDLMGPVPVAVVAERRPAPGLGIELGSGRLLVVGSSDIVANGRLGTLGNLNFFLSTANWMLEREDFLTIPARPISRYKLTLSEDDMRDVGLALLVPPLAFGLMGLTMRWLRRR